MTNLRSRLPTLIIGAVGVSGILTGLGLVNLLDGDGDSPQSPAAADVNVAPPEPIVISAAPLPEAAPATPAARVAASTSGRPRPKATTAPLAIRSPESTTVDAPAPRPAATTTTPDSAPGGQPPGAGGNGPPIGLSVVEGDPCTDLGAIGLDENNDSLVCLSTPSDQTLRWRTLAALHSVPAG